MARDPVCGMSVQEDGALRAVYGGRTYFFCSRGCQERFTADPALFLADAGEKDTHSEETDEQRVGPGLPRHGEQAHTEGHGGDSTVDPVCGMTVDPATAAHTFDCEGTTFHFCSAGCREKFVADPDRYLRPELQHGAPEHAGHVHAEPQTGTAYTCPMHPDIAGDAPGYCSECGMALEPLEALAPKTKVEYTCPMHPEVVSGRPSACPECGMALEPRTITLEEEENPEYVDMRRRFAFATALGFPVLAIAMIEHVSGVSLTSIASGTVWTMVQLVLTAPVVLWAGWPLLQRGWHSLVTMKLNMFTLIGLGVVVAFGYSLIAALFPGIFPASFRNDEGQVNVYFEAAAVITALVLLGQVMELRARSQTSSAIKALLGLAPKTAASSTCPSRRSDPAIGCASGRGRRCPWTVWWSRGRARSTNRWSPASRSRSRRARETRSSVRP
jgi:Cu+-exporting ATPase